MTESAGDYKETKEKLKEVESPQHKNAKEQTSQLLKNFIKRVGVHPTGQIDYGNVTCCILPSLAYES